MCGIVGYIGKRTKIGSHLVEGLKKLEYRGYDSCGITLITDKKLATLKVVGNTNKLATHKRFAKLIEKKSNCGIGHTRWATHGKISVLNAHPQISYDKSVALVHNGIIENYQEIKQMLEEKGITFRSLTDTEVITNLIAYLYKGSLVLAVNKALKKLKGSFAIAVLHKQSQEIVAARKSSPLLIGVGGDGYYVASDILGISSLYYSQYIVLADNHICKLTTKSHTVYDSKLNKVSLKVLQNTQSADVATKNGFTTFMEKEIRQIPETTKTTYNNLLKYPLPRYVNDIDNVIVLGCGTAFHAGSIGARLIRSYLSIQANSYIASEFVNDCHILTANTLVIAVSQSGETADTIKAVEVAKKYGCKVLSIVNVSTSRLASISDIVFPIFAGEEIGVASTKAYTCQVVAFFALINRLTSSNGKKLNINIDKLVLELSRFTSENNQTISNITMKFRANSKIFFTGRNNDYTTACEAALKLKEITYINANAIASGELKHGTLSLIGSNTTVVVFVTDCKNIDKQIGNINEIKSRGAYVIGVTQYQCIKDICDSTVSLSQSISDECNLILSIIPFFKLSFEVANKFNLNPDKPRNLAKSVTVE